MAVMKELHHLFDILELASELDTLQNTSEQAFPGSQSHNSTPWCTPHTHSSSCEQDPPQETGLLSSR